jgi:transcriptional regulator with XRE-family HTH domain
MSAIEYDYAFFPPPLVFDLVSWRERLRAAIDKSGMKHSLVAMDAGITPETLSRILTAEHQRPSLDTITRVAHAVNENVGWVLEERGFSLSADEIKQLREVVRFLDDTLLRAPLPHTIVPAIPNALRVRARLREIPAPFKALGARAVFQVTDDSLRDAGVIDGDLLYVKPATTLRDAAGQLVVCDVAGEPYAKVLEVKNGRFYLISRNERYARLEVYEIDAELVGVVVGRLGETRGSG